MSHCMVTLTANAGISLVLGQKVIWIDALQPPGPRLLDPLSGALGAASTPSGVPGAGSDLFYPLSWGSL